MYLLISMFLFKRGWLLTISFFFKFLGCQVCPNYILVFLTDSMYSLFRKPAKLLLKYNAAHIWGFAEIRQSVKRNIVVATELLIMYVHLVATMLPSEAYLGSINLSGECQIDSASQDYRDQKSSNSWQKKQKYQNKLLMISGGTGTKYLKSDFWVCLLTISWQKTISSQKQGFSLFLLQYLTLQKNS